MKIHFHLMLLFLSVASIAKAEITIPNIFSDEMVLQRETEVLLYGWASPNEEFTVYTSWNNETVKVKAGNDAKWNIAVGTPSAGGPYLINIKGADNEISLKNILIGDVWLCSGQSNMEWSANSGIDNKELEISKADYPNIRLFTVAKRTADFPLEDVFGTWEACTTETMPDFSAIAYFFARKVQKELDIPIGLIDASWGASCAEVWTPASVFEKYPELTAAHELLKPNKWVTIEKSTVYNAMIAPLTKFTISGALWYQGESNTANAETYHQIFTNMISSWRTKWKNDFPFYYVQIAPFKYKGAYNGGIVRDQQRRSLALKNTGMVMTSDICTIEDIHPQNKQDVGIRLANMALNQYYKVMEEEVYGPLFESATRVGNQMQVRFTHDTGLTSREKKIKLFDISDADGRWYAADATLKNGIVLVSSKEVKNPKSVRYAWKSTDKATLYNEAGLPASTFTSE
jgi:sialate O-acetylesterase